MRSIFRVSHILQLVLLKVLILSGYILCFLTSLYLYILIRIFCILVICLIFDVLFQSISFRMFCFKHLITFKNKYVLGSWFLFIYIFCIKFRLCETCTVANSVTRILFVETQTLELLSADLPHLYRCLF